MAGEGWMAGAGWRSRFAWGVWAGEFHGFRAASVVLFHNGLRARVSQIGQIAMLWMGVVLPCRVEGGPPKRASAAKYPFGCRARGHELRRDLWSRSRATAASHFRPKR